MLIFRFCGNFSENTCFFTLILYSVLQFTLQNYCFYLNYANICIKNIVEPCANLEGSTIFLRYIRLHNPTPHQGICHRYSHNANNILPSGSN